MTNTKAITQTISDAIETATEYGARPFSAWVQVRPNDWHGVDIVNERSGQTHRLADDDGQVTLYLFTGGASMLLAGSQTFTGCFAHGVSVGQALASLL